MSTPFYLGIGFKLLRASTSPPEPFQPNTYTIPTTKSSVGMAVNAGIVTDLNVVYGTAPAGTAFNIMYSSTNTFADEYILDTVAAVALQKVYTWSTANMIRLSGFIRITNAGGQDITAAYIQQSVGD